MLGTNIGKTQKEPVLCCKQLSNSRKEALSFLQGCQFVVGPAALPVNENICPDALTDNAVRNTCLVLSRFYL